MSITKKILEEKNYLLSLENIKQKELAKKDEMEVELQKNKMLYLKNNLNCEKNLPIIIIYLIILILIFL